MLLKWGFGQNLDTLIEHTLWALFCHKQLRSDLEPLCKTCEVE
mgnify:CR=1 FL=1